MLNRLCVSVALLLLASVTFAQSISLSFDDGFDPRVTPRAAEWNSAMLRALDAANIKSILYVVGKRTESPEGMQLVRAWADAGHAIGNHTFSHPNFGSRQVTFELFTADIVHNERVFGELPTWTRRLRFPYLKEGETLEKREALRRWLAANHYEAAPVSIDASDWYYSERFEKWRATHEDSALDAYRTAYLSHLWNRAQYYDGLSQRLLGRSATHVILLHTNAINAAFLPDVITMFRSRGWQIVKPEQANADALYRLAPQTLPAGESILWALAKERGIAGLRYPAEDGVYEAPLLDRLGL